MNRKTKQQPAKKGRPKKGENILLIKPEPVIKENDNELKLLTLMCSVIENWDESEKRRNLQFLFSKYGKYVTK